MRTPKAAQFKISLWLANLFWWPLLCCYGQVDWPSLGFTQVGSNTFSRPTFIAHAGDGSDRLFVGGQEGVLRVISSNRVVSETFLDLTSKVFVGAEQGLLGAAFSPGFRTNGQFYVNYTRKPDGATVISRFTVGTNANVVATNTEQIVLIVPQPFANHNGGHLAFGPDQFLYVGMGDGGYDSFIGDPLNHAQNPASLLGKLLRLDVEGGVATYQVPPSNPFVSNPAYAPEIWAVGLRNPWKFSFDRTTGDLYIGDVGHFSFEEIDFQPGGSPGGSNYGWSAFEGPAPYRTNGFDASSMIGPISWYPRGFNASVTGGYVYRGPNEPRMTGIYFFGDFVTGRLMALKREGTNWLRSEPIFTGKAISSFGEDEAGNLYLADYYSGRLWRLYDTRQALPSQLSPPGGSFNNDVAVTVTTRTIDSTLHFTLDGREPSESDPSIQSGGVIIISSNATLKVRTYRADLAPSQTVSAQYALQVANVTFSPASGPITNGTSLSLTSATAGVQVYYTTNGSSPDTNSTLYTGAFTIDANTLVSAMAVRQGFDPSEVVSQFFELLKVALPSFTPAQGPITNGASVEIRTATPGAIIRYTVDGTVPTLASPIYLTPLSFTNGTTLSARAFRNDLADSDVQSAFFGIVNFERTVVTTIAGGSISGFSNGIGKTAKFSGPQAVCVDAIGNLFVADTENHVIRKITPSGLVTTFAGSGVPGDPGVQVGHATNAQFYRPSGVAVDAAGNVYVANGHFCDKIFKIDTNMMVTELAALRPCYTLPGNGQLEVDSAGNLYAGSWATVMRISPSGGITYLAGSGLSCYDGWCGGVGPGIDAMTNIYAATEYKVWRTTPSGTDLFAGSISGFTDGPRLSALFDSPRDVAVDANTNLYISEYTRIRRLGRNGMVTTLAGSHELGYENGSGRTAKFRNAGGLCVDRYGNVYVADAGNHSIRKISADLDEDLIPDASEGSGGPFVVGINDAAVDSDHDGMSNSEEYRAGTDPLNAASVLMIDSVSVHTNSEVRIEWRSVSGKRYAVKFSSDLRNWFQLGDPVLGNGSRIAVTDEINSALERRVYRVFTFD
jgi:glucose/arabinose dehydrogenase